MEKIPDEKSIQELEHITQNKQSQETILKSTETLPDSTIVDQKMSNIPEEEFTLITHKKDESRHASKFSGKVIANFTILSHEQ
ncbi:15740_t:CDS:2, partial [Gigaspora rosea]